MSQLVQEIEKANLKSRVPHFEVGDTVKVHTRIIEGDKERVQVYVGTVVGRKGSGISETFTVTRVTFGYANEKIFPLHGPTIVKIEVVKRGDVRRAKLNYIRGKLGKSSKISAKIGGKVDRYLENDREDLLQEDVAPPEGTQEQS